MSLIVTWEGISLILHQGEKIVMPYGVVATMNNKSLVKLSNPYSCDIRGVNGNLILSGSFVKQFMLQEGSIAFDILGTEVQFSVQGPEE